uniref:RRM domain-containing protein n=1 Tax=Oryza punctata TaxID=4537 RepID=A0A0E0JP52_ORYPU
MEAEAETTVTVTTEEQRAATGGEGEKISRGRKLVSHGKVFVGGVPLGTSESELRAHFSQFGTVAFVGAPKNKQTGAARGFAFVQFVDPDAAAAAIAAGPDRNVLRGTTMDVKLATPKPSAGGPELSPGDQKRKIFIGGLPPSVTEQQLKEYFSKFGEVNRAIVVTELNTKMSRGFGFIQFASEESAARALKKDRHFVCGQWVEVSLAMPKQQNAASGTSKLSVQALPFYPATSSNFAAAANYPGTVNIVPVVTPMNCVVSNTYNPHIGFEVPGMILSQGVTNAVIANYSYYPYLGGVGVPPQGSAMYLQAAHYYSGAIM